MCFMAEPEDDLLHVETCCSTDKQTFLSKKLVLGLQLFMSWTRNGVSALKTIEHIVLPPRLLIPPHVKRTIP